MSPAQAIAQLQQLASGSTAAIKKAEFTVVNNIALTAIELAPEETTKLVESINVKQDENGSTVEVGAPYAAYLEFGTGANAAAYVPSLPEEWQEEAFKFFINGEGKTQAHPFFYPAVLAHQEELNNELQKEFEKLTQ